MRRGKAEERVANVPPQKTTPKSGEKRTREGKQETAEARTHTRCERLTSLFLSPFLPPSFLPSFSLLSPLFSLSLSRTQKTTAFTCISRKGLVRLQFGSLGFTRLKHPRFQVSRHVCMYVRPSFLPSQGRAGLGWSVGRSVGRWAGMNRFHGFIYIFFFFLFNAVSHVLFVSRGFSIYRMGFGRLLCCIFLGFFF